MEQLHFAIRNADLERILKSVAPVIPANPIVRAIENVHIAARGTDLIFTGTNLSTSIAIKHSDAELIADDLGEALLPHKEMSQLLAKLPRTTVNVCIEKTIENRINDGKPENVTKYTASIINEAGTFTFTCESAKDFPIPKGKFDKGFVLPAAGIKKALTIGWHSISDDDMRPAQCCANFRISKSRCLIETTNGRALSRFAFDIETDAEAQFMIHRTACKLIAALLDDENVSIQQSGNLLRITYLDAEITTRKVDERYPDTDNAIPGPSGKESIFDAAELTAALNRTLISAEKDSKLIRFSFEPNKISLRSEDIGRGKDASVEVTADVNFKMLIGFNGSLLIDLLAPHKGNVRAELNAPERAAMFYPEGEPNALLLLMPIMINNNA